MQWVHHFFVYLIQILLYLVILKIIPQLIKLSKWYYEKMVEKVNFCYMYDLMIIPLLCVGLILMVPLFVRGLIPSGIHSETSFLSPISTAAGVGIAAASKLVSVGTRAISGGVMRARK